MVVFWKRCAAGLAMAAATLAMAASPAGAQGVQVRAAGSDTPVMVSDLAESAADEVLYCAVRDGRFGCQNASPGQGLVVAILYYNANYRGDRVVIFNPDYRVGCSSGTGDNEGGANLGNAGGAISSVLTYNSCDIKLFDGNNATGVSTGWLDTAGTLGARDNKAHSFKIS